MNFYTPKNNQKGFTLIELLVVIAIIGFLSTVILASLSDARRNARDAKRQQEILAIKTALTANAIENKGVWYNTQAGNGGWYCLGRGAGTCHGGAWTGSTAFDTMLSTYFKAIPKDPLGPGTGALYGEYYMLNSSLDYDGSGRLRPVLHFGMESCSITAKTCMGGLPSTWGAGTSNNGPCNVNCMLPLD